MATEMSHKFMIGDIPVRQDQDASLIHLEIRRMDIRDVEADARRPFSPRQI